MRRFRYLLSQGLPGPTSPGACRIYGYDSDAPEARASSASVAWPSARCADMEVLFDQHSHVRGHYVDDHQLARGHHLGDVHRRGGKAGLPAVWHLRGTLQNDILKEYIAQKEFLFPPAPSMRLVTDTVEFGTHELPEWNTISISGYHIREAGEHRGQELAFTLADGFAYVRGGAGARAGRSDALRHG